MIGPKATQGTYVSLLRAKPPKQNTPTLFHPPCKPQKTSPKRETLFKIVLAGWFSKHGCDFKASMVKTNLVLGLRTFVHLDSWKHVHNPHALLLQIIPQLDKAPAICNSGADVKSNPGRSKRHGGGICVSNWIYIIHVSLLRANLVVFVPRRM